LWFGGFSGGGLESFRFELVLGEAKFKSGRPAPERKLLKDGNRGFGVTWLPIDSPSMGDLAIELRRDVDDSGRVEQNPGEFSVLCHCCERELKGSAIVAMWSAYAVKCKLLG